MRVMADVARQSVAVTCMAHSKVELAQEDLPLHAGPGEMCGVPNEGKLNLETQSSVQALELVVGGAKDLDSGEEFWSRQIQEKDIELGFWVRCAPVGRLLSAALYLFDVVSTLLVVKEYYNMDRLFTHRDSGPPSPGDKLGKTNIPWVSVAIVIIIVLAHVANALAFKLMLPHEEQPIMSAYFLPLIQLRRLLSDLWATGTCHSLTTLQSGEAEALYAIMACAVETGPQLALQLSILLNTSFDGFHHPTRIALCSIVACFLSGAFNGGRAIMYISNQRSNIRSYASAILGGCYTFAVLLVRCFIIAQLVTYDIASGESAKLAVYTTLALLSPMIMIFLSARPIMQDSLSTRKIYHYGVRVCYSIAFGYVSTTVGPIYAIVSDARARKKLKQHNFIVWLLVMAILHLIIDGIGLALFSTFSQYVCPQAFSEGVCPFFKAAVITGICLSIVSMASYIGLLIVDQMLMTIVILGC